MKQSYRERIGEEEYRRRMAEMGRKGGRVSKTGGFAANKQLAREAGAKGGKASSPPVKLHVIFQGQRISLLDLSKLTGTSYFTLYSKYKRGSLKICD